VPTPAMGAAPCRAGAPDGCRVAPMPHLHRPLAPSNHNSCPIKIPILLHCAPPPPFGVSFPKSAVATTRLKKEGGVGGMNEAQEAGEKLGARCGAWAATP
jgi:hypothetical protein